MKAQLFGIALAAVIGFAFTGSQTACSSSSSGSSSSGGSSGSGATGVSCAKMDGSECDTNPPGVPCTADQMMVSSCPSSNQLGCCATTGSATNGQTATITNCYYCQGAYNVAGTTASTFSSACSGSTQKWTAGDTMSCTGAGEGGAGSSSGTGSSSGSSSGAGDAASE